MQRLPRMRKERRRIKEKCDCTRPEDVVDWKKNKGVVGGIRDAIRPTTEEKAFLLALYEMTRLICINKCGADRSFSISGQKTLSIMWVYLEQDSGRKDGWNEGISGKKFEGS